jgi:hypothetical protein
LAKLLMPGPWEGGMRGNTADLSTDGLYRYKLTRRWADGPPMTWVMLNPSTADALADDATIRRCTGFARREGCGAIIVVNLFGYRATDPNELTRTIDPIGSGNALELGKAAGNARAWGTPLVVAWGNPPRFARRWASDAARNLADTTTLLCLGTTQAGQPRHPVRLAADTPPRPWTPVCIV